jgi:hypothetical protein
MLIFTSSNKVFRHPILTIVMNTRTSRPLQAAFTGFKEASIIVKLSTLRHSFTYAIEQYTSITSTKDNQLFSSFIKVLDTYYKVTTRD